MIQPKRHTCYQKSPDGLEVYSGDDSLNLALLSIGAVGVVGVATHWSGLEHQNLIQAVLEGDYSKAKEINQQLQPSFAFESSPEAPNPIPTKVMMNILGFNVGKGGLQWILSPTILKKLPET